MNTYFTTFEKRRGEIKIGQTTRQASQRASDGSTWLGKGHRVHLILPGGDREWHARFAPSRLDGEWFRLTPSLIEFVNNHPGRLLRLETPQSFAPNEKIPGGSSKGKPQSRWPMVYIVTASAIQDRAAGGLSTRIENRKSPLSTEEFERQMDVVLPGCWDYAPGFMPGRSTNLVLLLKNRTYKGDTYSGTSDRGRDHDPRTRASVPREHWRNRVPVGHVLRSVYDKVLFDSAASYGDWIQELISDDEWPPEVGLMKLYNPYYSEHVDADRWMVTDDGRRNYGTYATRAEADQAARAMRDRAAAAGVSGGWSLTLEAADFSTERDLDEYGAEEDD